MAEQDRQGEVHRADPAYRRQMQAVLVATLVVGTAAIVALQWWLGRLGANAGGGDLLTYETWLHRLLGGLCLVLAVSAAVFAAWLHGVARETARERRWPPSAMRTSADVRVRYLTSADALVAQLRGGAIALAVMAALLAGWAIWLFLRG
jgi:hypothetical protein